MRLTSGAVAENSFRSLRASKWWLASFCLASCCVSAIAQTASAPTGGPPGLSAHEVARVFQQACMANEGKTSAVIDWALSKGYETVNPMRVGTEALLGGQPGTVLEVPGSGGAVLLAAAQETRCTVWAQQLQGPPVRSAMVELMSRLRNQGARVQFEVDRDLERAGAQRNHLQWRYRAIGGSQDFGVAVVTTLNTALGGQLLSYMPLAPVSRFAPDGLPR